MPRSPLVMLGLLLFFTVLVFILCVVYVVRRVVPVVEKLADSLRDVAEQIEQHTGSAQQVNQIERAQRRMGDVLDQWIPPLRLLCMHVTSETGYDPVRNEWVRPVAGEQPAADPQPGTSENTAEQPRAFPEPPFDPQDPMQVRQYMLEQLPKGVSLTDPHPDMGPMTWLDYLRAQILRIYGVHVERDATDTIRRIED